MRNVRLKTGTVQSSGHTRQDSQTAKLPRGPLRTCPDHPCRWEQVLFHTTTMTPSTEHACNPHLNLLLLLLPLENAREVTKTIRKTLKTSSARRLAKQLDLLFLLLLPIPLRLPTATPCVPLCSLHCCHCHCPCHCHCHCHCC